MPSASVILQDDSVSYRRILNLSGPLVLSQLGVVIMQVIDAVFLAWHSQDALAAVGPSGILFWAVLSLFMGVAGYSTTFVAQYVGAGRRDRVGAAVWQGVYASLLGGALLAVFSLAAPPIFHLARHGPVVEALEIVYFQIFCWGAGLFLLSAALSGFFSGRGDNMPLMAVQLSGLVVNGLLAYAWVLGRWGFPSWGMAGAAYATLAAQAWVSSWLAVLMLRQKHRDGFATWAGRRLDASLLFRMTRYGLPNGLRMLVEVAVWAIFIGFAGRIGELELAASNVAFRLNTLAFMPMFGVGVAANTLVGQCMGANRPDLAQRCVWRGLMIAEVWMVAVALLFVLAPHPLVEFFREEHATVEQFMPLRDLTTNLLRFVAVYSLLDACNVVVLSALQGAGDTRWTAAVSAVMHLGFLSLLVAMDMGHAGVYSLWCAATVFVMVLSAVWLVRVRGGRWKSHRVIERDAPGEEG